MKILLKRFSKNNTSVIGSLYVDGVYVCRTLEDKQREKGEPKVPGQTAIPGGVYKLVIDMSKRFGVPMPHILDVPGFEGVRIHPGNTDKDTEGCVLVGEQIINNGSLGNSRVAYTKLFKLLKDTKDEITIEVKEA